MTLLAGEGGIEMLFTDLGLGDDPQAGLALAQEAIKLRPELPVVYTSGQSATDGMRAMFVGGSAFLPKPYTVDDLTAALDRLTLLRR